MSGARTLVAALGAILSSASSGGRAAFAEPVAQGPQDAAPSGLLAGVARVDLSPPAGVPQMNWGSQTHVFGEGVDQPGILATAIVLSDGKQSYALVDVDRGGTAGLESAIDQAAARTGIPAAHIRIGATHTHAGPALSPGKGPVGVDLAAAERAFEAYQAKVHAGIVDAIVAARGALRPVHAHGARGVGTININRRRRASGGQPASVGRNPAGFVDRDLIVVRFDDAKGKPYAVLVNYACHGIVLTHENKLHSPDFVGMVRETVEQALPGALALFIQGAAGNLGPVEWGTGDVGVAHRLGGILGLQAAALARQIETVRREPTFEGFTRSTAVAAREPWRVLGPRAGDLSLLRKVIPLPRRRYGPADVADMARQVRKAAERAAEAEARGEAWEQAQAKAELRRVSELLDKRKAAPDPRPVEVEVQILRIGDMAVVAMPGEPFAEIGAAIKKASPFAVTLFSGYSTGKGGGYMPVRSEYRHGGYEVDRTPYGEGAAEKLIGEVSRMLRGMKPKPARLSAAQP
jgi:hypothetical protein